MSANCFSSTSRSGTAGAPRTGAARAANSDMRHRTVRIIIRRDIRGLLQAMAGSGVRLQDVLLRYLTLPRNRAPVAGGTVAGFNGPLWRTSNKGHPERATATRDPG